MAQAASEAEQAATGASGQVTLDLRPADHSESPTQGPSSSKSRGSEIGITHTKADGRMRFPSQSQRDEAQHPEDPFWWLFVGLERMQELAIPLIVGAIVAMLIANIDWDTYEYYFTSDRCDEAEKVAYAASHPEGGTCHSDRWVLLNAPIFGHSLTLHFVANDLVMCFHFGLAMKEVTEVVPAPRISSH